MNIIAVFEYLAESYVNKQNEKDNAPVVGMYSVQVECCVEWA